MITRASGAGKIYVDAGQTATATTSNGASTSVLVPRIVPRQRFFVPRLMLEVYLYASAWTGTQLAAINANEVITVPFDGLPELL